MIWSSWGIFAHFCKDLFADFQNTFLTPYRGHQSLNWFVWLILIGQSVTINGNLLVQMWSFFSDNLTWQLLVIKLLAWLNKCICTYVHHANAAKCQSILRIFIIAKMYYGLLLPWPSLSCYHLLFTLDAISVSNLKANIKTVESVTSTCLCCLSRLRTTLV